jgi:hypothetical protein
MRINWADTYLPAEEIHFLAHLWNTCEVTYRDFPTGVRIYLFIPSRSDFDRVRKHFRGADTNEYQGRYRWDIQKSRAIHIYLRVHPHLTPAARCDWLDKRLKLSDAA